MERSKWSLSLKPSPNLEISINQFNSATQKIVMSLKKFLHVNITTLRKHITLKYLTKVNHYPYSIRAYSHNKILMTFNIFWVAPDFFWHNSNKWNKNLKQVSLLNNLNLNNYSFQFTPTETSAGGTLLYIASHLWPKYL